MIAEVPVYNHLAPLLLDKHIVVGAGDGTAHSSHGDLWADRGHTAVGEHSPPTPRPRDLGEPPTRCFCKGFQTLFCNVPASSQPKVTCVVYNLESTIQVAKNICGQLKSSFTVYLCGVYVFVYVYEEVRGQLTGISFLRPSYGD